MERDEDLAGFLGGNCSEMAAFSRQSSCQRMSGPGFGTKRVSPQPSVYPFLSQAADTLMAKQLLMMCCATRAGGDRSCGLLFPCTNTLTNVLLLLLLIVWKTPSETCLMLLRCICGLLCHPR